MFTWEKVKWSIFVYWTQLWRSVLFTVVAMLVLFVIMLTPAFLNPEALTQFSNAELDVKITMHTAYSLHYWYQQMFVPGIALLCFLFVGLIFGAIYIQYYSMFKKNYRSFSRQFNKPEVLSLWSWGFWKPFIFITVFGLLIGFGVGTVLEALMVREGLVSLVSLIVGLVLFYVFLQGGTWGFVPVEKQQTMLTK